MFDVLTSPVAERLINRARAVQPELVQEVIGVSEVPAPTFQEEQRAAHVLGRMRALGLEDAGTDAAGNVMARLGRGPGPVVLVAAHLDTVFPPGVDVRVRQDGDLLHGPGVGDNAASVAVMLWAGQLLVESGLPLPGQVILASTVGEEGLGNLRGMRALLDSLADRVDYVIALDGTLGGLVREAVGSRRFRIAIESEGGHSWGAFGAPSAIHALGKIVAKVADLPVPQQPKTTFNVGVIAGGTAVNAIASRAEALVDLRSVDGAELRRLEVRVRDIVAQVAGQEAVTAQMQMVGERPAGAVADDHPLCRAVRAVHQRLGIPTRTYPSSTDGNLPLSRGIPAVTIGVSQGGNGHRTDEYIQIPPLTRGLAQVALLLLATLELAPRSR